MTDMKIPLADGSYLTWADAIDNNGRQQYLRIGWVRTPSDKAATLFRLGREVRHASDGTTEVYWHEQLTPELARSMVQREGIAGDVDSNKDWLPKLLGL